MNISGGVLVALAGIIIGVWGKELVLAIFEKMFGKKNGNGNGSYYSTPLALKLALTETIEQKLSPFHAQQIEALNDIKLGINTLVTLAQGRKG